MITEQILKQIVAQVDASGVNESSMPALRAKFPNLHFTWCSEDDVPDSTAAWEAKQFSLYLIDGREHCLCLTTNKEIATGVVVAEIYEE